MAEVGNILSGLSLSKDVVDTSLQLFRYIRIARDSEIDISLSSVQLRLLELRYSRCAEVFRTFASSPANGTDRLVQESCQAFKRVLVKAEKTVQNLSKGAAGSQTVVEAKIEEIIGSRRHARRDSGAEVNESASMSSTSRSMSFTQRIQWVLFSRDQFREWISALTENIDQLEKLFPSAFINAQDPGSSVDTLCLEEADILSMTPEPENQLLREALQSEPSVYPDLSSELANAEGPIIDSSGNMWTNNRCEGGGLQRNGDVTLETAKLKSRNNRWVGNIVSGPGRQQNGNAILRGVDPFWGPRV
ncbi:hypothetical protein N0V90_004951 [Kalmusia sp. IMI 367209]|nr:hypothetical protein N0V90_004951 [Kalmusia sp. IMI 367209]